MSGNCSKTVFRRVCVAIFLSVVVPRKSRCSVYFAHFAYRCFAKDTAYRSCCRRCPPKIHENHGIPFLLPALPDVVPFRTGLFMKNRSVPFVFRVTDSTFFHLFAINSDLEYRRNIFTRNNTQNPIFWRLSTIDFTKNSIEPFQTISKKRLKHIYWNDLLSGRVQNAGSDRKKT